MVPVWIQLSTTTNRFDLGSHKVATSIELTHYEVFWGIKSARAAAAAAVAAFAAAAASERASASAASAS